MDKESKHEAKDKRFLVAVDGSESSKRAVIYVADLLGSLPGFSVTLFSIIHVPEKDFFNHEDEGHAWLREKTEQTEKMLNNYRQVLIQAGFSEDKVDIETCVNDGKSLADAILRMRCDLTCCTVVVGRHHKSKTEEFLFGSTSSKLVHEAKNCAVWVVE